MPKVYNRHHANAPVDAIWVGRPTPYGNPFTMHGPNTRALVHVENRAVAVYCYEKLLECRTTDDVMRLVPTYDSTKLNLLLSQAEWIRNHVKELHDKDLVCVCAPLDCHGDVLLRYAKSS